MVLEESEQAEIRRRRPEVSSKPPSACLLNDLNLFGSHGLLADRLTGLLKGR